MLLHFFSFAYQLVDLEKDISDMIPELDQMKTSVSASQEQLETLLKQYEDQVSLFQEQRGVVEALKHDEEKLIKDYEGIMTPIEADQKGS